MAINHYPEATCLNVEVSANSPIMANGIKNFRADDVTTSYHVLFPLVSQPVPLSYCDHKIKIM